MYVPVYHVAVVWYACRPVCACSSVGEYDFESRNKQKSIHEGVVYIVANHVVIAIRRYEINGRKQRR